MSEKLEILTSQHPRGSPLAASNPADMMVMSGANAEAAKQCVSEAITWISNNQIKHVEKHFLQILVWNMIGKSQEFMHIV